LALAELLISRGIGVEIGLSDAAGTRLFVESAVRPGDRSQLAEMRISGGAGVEAEALAPQGLASRCLRILLEPFEPSAEAAQKTLEQIEAMLDAAGVRLPRVLHGLNHTAWNLIDLAASRGYDTRVGFEDILLLPEGTLAPGNGTLVLEAARRMHKSPVR
jgi:hypothetical protein